MTHLDAVEQMLVERSLLGELTGDARNQFEDHLFDCQECAADLKQGVLFLDAARQELKSTQKVASSGSPVSVRRSIVFAKIWQPWVLAPALAACLAVIVYQSAFVLPRLKAQTGAQVAQAQVPEVVESLVLANAGARGGSVAEIVAPRYGVYLLSVDIPPSPGARLYRCSLYAPSGTPVWHIDITPQQARDAVTIQVPSSTSSEGMNELHVQSVTSSQLGGDRLVDLATYRYKVKLAE